MQDKELLDALPKTEDDVPRMALQAALFIRATRELTKENEMLRTEIIQKDKRIIELEECILAVVNCIAKTPANNTEVIK